MVVMKIERGLGGKEYVRVYDDGHLTLDLPVESLALGICESKWFRLSRFPDPTRILPTLCSTEVEG